LPCDLSPAAYGWLQRRFGRLRGPDPAGCLTAASVAGQIPLNERFTSKSSETLATQGAWFV
jgi:hypothetical protein